MTPRTLSMPLAEDSMTLNSDYQHIAKGRFAPSPTGRMHLGNIYCALVSWLSARRQGGSWLLRIEDLDTGRSRQEFSEHIMDDLTWLGLTWDEGPYYQSQRSDIYEEYFRRLDTYPCFCTRADLMAASAPHASDGRHVYAGTCRTLSPTLRPQRRPAWRVRVPDVDISFSDLHYGRQHYNMAAEWGDFVVRRADGTFAYQLAVTVDDALMGVTEVVRGVDLLSSTAPQLFLYHTLGLREPVFGHVPLLCNESGQRLCKRDLALDMGQLRQRHTAEGIIGKLAYGAGLIDQLVEISARELVEHFDWKRLRQQPSIIVDDNF